MNPKKTTIICRRFLFEKLHVLIEKHFIIFKIACFLDLNTEIIQINIWKRKQRIKYIL